MGMWVDRLCLVSVVLMLLYSVGSLLRNVVW